MSGPQLLGMTEDELTAFMEQMGERPFRARQIRASLLKGLAFEEMTDLPRALRAELERRAGTGVPRIEKALASDEDETVKFLFSFADGEAVEGVLMAYKYGNTLCVSTQAGCAMGCAFCASGVGGKVRDLLPFEMLGEVIAAGAYIRKTRDVEPDRRPVDNVVLMGSGEPLDNFDNVVAFLETLGDPDGLNMSMRHVSVSTCGMPERMRALTDTGLRVTLCVSLHAPNDEIRRRLMPVAKRYPIEEVVEAARYHVRRTGRRAIFEYILVRGVNDAPEHARELAARLRGLQCHVNLIACNPVDHADLCAPAPGTIARFERELKDAHISCTRRRVLGADIEGACGQLKRRAKTAQGPAKGENP